MLRHRRFAKWLFNKDPRPDKSGSTAEAAARYFNNPYKYNSLVGLEFTPDRTAKIHHACNAVWTKVQPYIKAEAILLRGY